MRLGGVIWPNSQVLTLSCSWWMRFLGQANLLIKETRQSSYLSLRSRFQLSASLWNYSNRPITPSHGNWGTAISWYYSLPPTTPGYPLCSRVQSWVTLCDMQCPPPPELWLINCSPSQLSSVRCHELSHPCCPKAGPLPHKLGEWEVLRTGAAPLTPHPQPQLFTLTCVTA